MTQDSPFGFGVPSRRALHKMKMHLTSEPRSLHLQQRQSCNIYDPDHFVADNMLNVLIILKSILQGRSIPGFVGVGWSAATTASV